jgi:hypothetical protein
MGEQGFRTGGSTTITAIEVGGAGMTQDSVMSSTDTFELQDDKVPTAKLAQDRVDTISSAEGFHQKVWGEVLTTSGVDYIPIDPSVSSAQGPANDPSNSNASGNTYFYSAPRFYPFCNNQEMSLRGVSWKVSPVSDGGPLWFCLWQNTQSISGVSNGPGALIAYVKATFASNPSVNSCQIFVDDGNDGVVYNASHVNGQVTIPVGMYWFSIHAQQNQGGTNSYAMIQNRNPNESRWAYAGGGQGLTMGYSGVSFGRTATGIYYDSSALSPNASTWTPPASFTDATKWKIDTAKGPYDMAFLML